MAGRAKTLPYPELIKQGVIPDGDVLRYITKQGELLGVGVAREKGIQIKPGEKPVGPTAFEAACGSKAHRPNEFTQASNSLTLQEAIARHLASGEGSFSSGKPTKKARPQVPTPLIADQADDLCRLCGYGGDLMVCETCPVAFHASCLGLPSVPEGDWHCPRCRCAVCGNGSFDGELAGSGEAVGAPGDADGAVLAWCAAGGGAGAARPLAHVPNYEEGLYQALRERQRGAEAAQGQAAAAGAGEGDGAAASRVKQEAAGASWLPDRPGAAAPPADARCMACPSTGQRRHVGCAVKADPAGPSTSNGHAPARTPHFIDAGAAHANRHFAAACMRGPVACGVEMGGVPVSWQLIRGAAVRDPEACRDCYPAYDEGQRGAARQLLSGALVLLRRSLPPVRDAYTGQEVLALLLQGWVGPGGAADMSGVHTAVLMAGGTLVAAACMRAFGQHAAEVPLLAVRPELRGNGCGRLLLRCIESCCMDAGVQLLVQPAVLPPQTPDAALVAPALQAAAWAKRCGYQEASPAQRAALVAYPLLFFLRVPLLAKVLRGQDDLTVAHELPPGPLVLQAGAALRGLAKYCTALYVPPPEESAAEAATAPGDTAPTATMQPTVNEQAAAEALALQAAQPLQAGATAGATAAPTPIPVAAAIEDLGPAGAGDPEGGPAEVSGVAVACFEEEACRVHPGRATASAQPEGSAGLLDGLSAHGDGNAGMSVAAAVPVGMVPEGSGCKADSPAAQFHAGRPPPP